MAFQVEELSIQLIEALVPLMPRIRQRDKSLEDQLRRAASSIGLNCAEAAMKLAERIVAILWRMTRG